MFLILGIVLGIYVITMFIPLFWGVIQSFKGPVDWNGDKTGFVGKLEGWMWENYTNVFKYFKIKTNTDVRYGLPMMFLYSVLYALGGAIVQVTVQYVMAYVSARFRYKFGTFIVGMVIFCMALPIVGSQAASLSLATHMGLKNNIIGMWLMKAYFLGMYFLVFHAQLKAFPMDFSEAASIDGAGNFTIMWRITFPMVRNTYLTVILLLFVAYWNDYQTPMLYLPEKPTLALGLYYFMHESHRIAGGDFTPQTPHKLGACVVVLVPILIVFMLLHKKLLGNLSMGGLKE